MGIKKGKVKITKKPGDGVDMGKSDKGYPSAPGPRPRPIKPRPI